MFKYALFVALCLAVLAEGKPTEGEQGHRVARQVIPNPFSSGMNMGAQMAGAGADAVGRLADVGKNLANGFANGAMGGLPPAGGPAQG